MEDSAGRMNFVSEPLFYCRSTQKGAQARALTVDRFPSM